MPEGKDLFLEIYTYLHTSILDKSIQRINLGQNGQGKILDNFYTKLEKMYSGSVAIDWMVDYCIYQVHYWYDKTTQHKVTLGWVMGDKALKRYLDRPKGKDYHEDRMLARKLKMSREEVKNKWRRVEVAHPLEQYKNPVHEEPIKAKFLNQDIGYYQCEAFTTLYSNCKICVSCKFNEVCKKSLKKLYPELARLRSIR